MRSLDLYVYAIFYSIIVSRYTTSAFAPPFLSLQVMHAHASSHLGYVMLATALKKKWYMQ